MQQQSVASKEFYNHSEAKEKRSTHILNNNSNAIWAILSLKNNKNEVKYEGKKY